MRDTPVFDGCPSHGEGRTAASTREFDWDGDIDEVGLGAGVLAINSTLVCLDMQSVVAQLLGLPLKGSQRVVLLAATDPSHIRDGYLALSKGNLH